MNLPVGNTKVVANMIREITGGNVFQIDTVKFYPKDYSATTNVAKKELNGNDLNFPAMWRTWNRII